jgi:hypothetical protein
MNAEKARGACTSRRKNLSQTEAGYNNATESNALDGGD